MLSFLCPACRQKLTAAPQAAGRAMKCPRCQQRLVVPQPPATVPSGPVPPPGGVPTVTMPPTPLSQHETCGVSQSGARTDAPPDDRRLNLGDILSPPRAPGELGRLGQYSVLKVLGAGGMGVVLHARDNQLERFVALKVMRPSHASEAGRMRFLREARAAAAIEHDHIIPIFQVGEERGVPFLAMPLLQGEALDVRLRREGKLPAAEVLRIGKEIAAGLAAAHERGLIHRDIKPANVWLEGKTGRVKILDFGLARAAGEVTPPSGAPLASGAIVPLSAGIAAQLTQAGSILGTPSYMAPEQAAGKAVDARCDLFSLGCVLYALSTGQLPFKGKNLSAILAAVASHTPAAPRRLNPDVPAALSDLIMHLLAKESSARPASAATVVEVLDRLRLAPSGPSGWKRRRRTVLAAGLLLALASVVLAIVLLTRSPKVTKDIVDRDKEVLDDSADVPRLSFEELSRRSSPLDDWKRETLSDVALALAGRGDPAKAPAELVGMLGDPRFRQRPEVFYPAYSPDGQLLAVANAHNVRLFQARTGRLLRTLTGHTDRVFLVAFSPDGRKLAATSLDGTIKLWDTAGGKMLWSGRDGGAPLWGVAFRPDGSLVAGGGDDGKVRLWDAATGARRHVLSGHRGRTFQAAFRPDGGVLATSSGFDGKVRLWDPDSGELKQTLEHSPDPGPRPDEHLYLNVAFSPDGRLMATGDDLLLKLWDATTFQLLRTVPTPAMFLAFSPDSHILFTARTRHKQASGFHTMQRWRTDTGQALASFTLQSRGQWAAYQLSPDGRTLACSESGDTLLRFHDAETGKPFVAEPGHTREVIGVAFSPDGKHLASGSRDNTIKIWDLATRKELRTLTGHAAEVRRVAFSPNGKLLASCSFDRTVRLWDVASGRRLRTLAEHTGSPHNIAFSPDGKRLASASIDRTIRIWDVAGGWEIHVLRGHEDNVEGVAFSPDGQTLASASKDGTVRLWDTRTGEQKDMRRHSAPLVSIAYLPDGRTLAVGGHDHRVWLWDVASGEVRNLPLAEHPVVYGLAVRGDGRLLAGSGSDSGVTLWDLQTTPPRQRTLFFHPADPWVGDVAFSPEGRHLATANPNGTIYILKVPSTLPRP